MSKKICQYRNSDYPEYACEREIDEGDLCIFHVDKPYKNPSREMTDEERTANFNYSMEFREKLIEYMNSVKGDRYEFVGFVFPKIDWRAPNFEKIADFRYSKFPEGFEFGSDLIFHETALFRNVEFYYVYFNSNMIFKKHVDFREAVFRDCNINGIIFEDYVSFENTKFFGRKIKLDATRFKGDVTFHNTTFEKEDEVLSQVAKFDSAGRKKWLKSKEPEVNFSGSEFGKSCSFHNSDFFVKANFNSTKFKGRTNIFKTTFHKQADFTHFETNQAGNFIQTTFNENAIFNYGKVKGELSFLGNENRCFTDECYFNKLYLSKDTNLSFDKANLGKASFIYTNLEKVDFIDVDWCKSELKNRWFNYFPKRLKLWDETRFHQYQPTLERVADNYRQLVTNYEGKRNFEFAEFFHIGEMEIRRKKHRAESAIGITNKWWRRFRGWFNVTGAYWLTSRYGTSYAQAVSILIILALFVVPLLFLFAGFQKIGGSQIDYTIIPNTNFSFSRLISDFGDAISYTFSIVTFQRERFFEPTNDLFSQFALYISVIILTTQFALVLLAIRRQFKR